jgi:hypothetical protein
MNLGISLQLMGRWAHRIIPGLSVVGEGIAEQRSWAVNQVVASYQDKKVR